ncbi:MAG: DUF262 domain-containing protein [Planctomycetes bacterium]|nr:DUF262 domain-containing protein [Planctomycetota bacterium]
MAIQRSGPTPAFYEYITEYALIPQKEKPASDLFSAAAGLNIQWVEVPSYQRGISWHVSTIEELLESSSAILGNVILGQFNIKDNKYCHLHEGVRQYVVMVDGLQRFSVGTALLSCLYNLVLKTEPEKPEIKNLFYPLALRVNGMAPVFLHNDKELRFHPRKAISGAYNEFRNEVQSFLLSELESNNLRPFSDKVCNLFLSKQIAIDIYFNFNNSIEIINSFIGINTIRVDLSPVDLLRSFIVERAFNSNWQASDIENIENELTDVFVDKEQPKTELLPFVAILLKYLRMPNHAEYVFPTWESSLAISDVAKLLEFVRKIINVNNCPIIDEIRACGSIPLAGILSHYYSIFRDTATMPGFISGRKEEYGELYDYLRAMYRQVINGTVGKAREYAEKMLIRDFNSLSEAADQIAITYTKTSLDKKVDEAWLKVNLKRLDLQRSKRVFNALRLPIKGQSGPENFRPDIYGNKSKEYHVDHLIPVSTIELSADGSYEAQSLPNLAPLPSNYNKEAKATPCSIKLSKEGIYRTYSKNHPHPHPYSVWLIENQSSHGSFLDRQELLEPNSDPAIGSERIEWLSRELRERL